MNNTKTIQTKIDKQAMKNFPKFEMSLINDSWKCEGAYPVSKRERTHTRIYQLETPHYPHPELHISFEFQPQAKNPCHGSGEIVGRFDYSETRRRINVPFEFVELNDTGVDTLMSADVYTAFGVVTLGDLLSAFLGIHECMRRGKDKLWFEVRELREKMAAENAAKDNQSEGK